jgi:hypothetical protein
LDPVELAILALRLVLVGVLYLFLWLVMRAALGSLRQAAPARAVRRPLVLALIEPGASSLERGAQLELQEDSVFGRAAPAAVVLDDPAVSAQHARVEPTRGGWLVSDLGSTNGTRVNERPINGSVRLRKGDALALGPIRFEVRDT